MHNFKLGDRIVVYKTVYSIDPIFYKAERLTGTVIENFIEYADMKNLVAVMIDEKFNPFLKNKFGSGIFHEKQCRKLVMTMR